jgi:hypothetical protein
MLPDLCSQRVRRVVVYDYRPSIERLERCLSQVNKHLHKEIELIDKPTFSKEIAQHGSGQTEKWFKTQVSIRQDYTTEIFLTNTWPGSYAHVADVFSIHLPYNEQTMNFVSSDMIAHLPTSACVIIASRGNIADEKALVDRYLEGKLLGVAADTVVQEAERQRDSRLSPLWDFYRKLTETGEPHNVIVTPHIAGTSSSDTNRIVEDVSMQIESAWAQFVGVKNPA